MDLLLNADRERRARLDRAKLRSLEQVIGEATDADGEYWLARVAALEHVAAAADLGDAVYLARALDRLHSIRAPACRKGDHQIAA